MAKEIWEGTWAGMKCHSLLGIQAIQSNGWEGLRETGSICPLPKVLIEGLLTAVGATMSPAKPKIKNRNFYSKMVVEVILLTAICGYEVCIHYRIPQCPNSALSTLSCLFACLFHQECSKLVKNTGNVPYSWYLALASY